MPATPSESAPNLSTFTSAEGGSGGAGAAGGIVGTKGLQASVDKFDSSVTKLEGIVTKLQAIPALSGSGGMLGSMGSSKGQTNAGGFPAMGAAGGAAGAFPKVSNPFPTSSSAYSSQTAYGGQMCAPGQMPASKGTNGGFPNVQNPFGQQPQGQSSNGGITPPPSAVYPPGQTPPGMSGPQTQSTNGGFPNVQNPFGGPSAPQGPGGGGAGGPGGGRGSANGGGGQQQQQQQQGPTLGQMASTAVAGSYAQLAGSGANNMAGQVSLNSYQFGSSIGGIGPGGGTQAGNQKMLAQQAYGTAGGGSQGAQKQNIFGQSPQDLAQAFSIMGQQAGNPMLNQSSLGSNLLKGTAQFGYLNPAMSATQSASAMQQLYSPQSSMKQRMLGYTTTPLQAGKPGGANSMAAWAAGQFRTMDFGGMNKKPTASQMRAELGPNGIMSANLQAEGLNPSQYAAPLETYNALYQGSGLKGKSHPALNVSQAQKLMSGLSSQNKNTQKQSENTLQNYGVNKNDLDKLKGVAGAQAASQGDKSAGFTSGLTAATTAITNFTNALNKALNALHANNAIGAGQGFAGTMKTTGASATAGGIAGFAGSMLGHGMLGKAGGGLLGKVLGKGGGGAGGAAGGAEGAAEGGGGGLFGDMMGFLGASGSGGASVMGGVSAGAAASTLGIAGAAAGAEGLAHHLLGKVPGAHGKGKTSAGGHLARAGQDFTSFNNIEPQHLVGHMWDAGKNILSSIGGLFGGGAAAAMSPVIAGKSKKTNTVSSGVTKTAKTAVKMAESQQGVPYQWGAETPGKGFDCAGLTQWAYASAGVKLPRTAKEQWDYLQKNEIKIKDVKEGDLVFGEGSGGQLGHVGLMVDNKKVIQAPQPGSKVAVSSFAPAQWLHAARPSGGKAGKQSTHGGAAGTSKNPLIKAGSNPSGSPAGSPSSSPPAKGGGKTTTGATIAAYAEKFAGHQYVLGGPGDYQTKHDPPFGAWDCAGFVSQMYDHFGLGSPTKGINVSALIGWSKKTSGPVVGGMAFFAGSDGTSSHPGHVGMVTGKNKSIQAMDEAQGTRNASLAGAVAFGVPPKGFAGGGTAAGNSGGSGGSGAQLQNVLAGSSSGGGMGGADLGTGDSQNEGSTSELSAFGGAISGGASAGSGYYGTRTIQTEVVPGSGGSGSGSGGKAPAGNGVTGIAALAKYLKSAGYSKPAAAGAAGVAGGEGTGANPEISNCVPLTYKVVTTRGILAHDEVRIGDHTVVYSPKTGQVEEAEILDVPYHYDAKICRIGNINWSVICTVDHKWITSDGELVRADELEMGAKLMLGDGWLEPVYFFHALGREDTFCLTTTTGTWTAYRDEQVASSEGVEAGEFWTGNSGGYGLIGWTPPFSASEQSAGAVPPRPTGNAGKDMAAQEVAMVKWMKLNGWPPPQNSFPNTLAGAMSAARAASAAYERPAVAGSDVHAASISTAFNALATGGRAEAGSTFLAGERGPELVQVGGKAAANVISSDQTQKLLKSAVGSPEGPWSKGGGSSFNYSSAHPIYSGGTGGRTKSRGGGITTLNINVTMPPGTGSAGGATTGTLTTSAYGHHVATEIAKALHKLDIVDAIASGSNS